MLRRPSSRSARLLGLPGMAHDLPQGQWVCCKPQRGPHVPHEQQNGKAVQTLEAERTFMMMIAKTNGMSPGMSQAQKTFTSCRHRAGHQQPMRHAVVRSRRHPAAAVRQHGPAGDEAGRCRPTHQ